MEVLMSEEQRMITQAVRRFVREEVQPLERDLDPDAVELPPGELDRLKEIVRGMGLYHIDVPEAYGGPGLPLTTRGLVAEEMSQHRAGLYLPCYGAFGSAGLAQLYDASDEQKERYLYPMLRGEKRAFFGLTEPSGGSDPARAIQTRAIKDGDEWVLNGSKLFSSGADRAEFGLVFARTDPSKGRRGISAFLVDTDSPGFEVRRVVHTLRSANYGTELSSTMSACPQPTWSARRAADSRWPTPTSPASAFPIRRPASGSPSPRRRWRSPTASSARPLALRSRRGKRSSG